MEKLNLLNGNRQEYNTNLPKICILTEYINDGALRWIKERTDLEFTKKGWAYETQPQFSWQIVNLLLTYNFKTKYYNNADHDNVLFLKFAEYGTALTEF